MASNQQNVTANLDMEQGASSSAANNTKVLDAQVSGKAQTAMICGIIGIFIFGIILGPIAICLGSSAKEEIKASNGKLKGEGKAQTGIVCGIIAVIIWLIVVVTLFI